MMDDPWPAVQLVPAASCMTTDHTPLAHCWYESPRQFQVPSVEQAEPGVSVVPLEVDEVVDDDEALVIVA